MSNKLAGLNALRQIHASGAADTQAYIDRLIADEIAADISKLANPLPVPWVSQLGTTANQSPGDCGPAVLASWLQFLGRGQVTADQVGEWVGLKKGYNFTMPAHLIRAARHWKVDLYWRRMLTLKDVYTEIDAGRPAIALVHYPYLPVRFDANYFFGHWLLVIGYTNTDVVYLDPYWTKDGQKSISRRGFDRAWGANHRNGNSDRQLLRMRA